MVVSLAAWLGSYLAVWWVVMLVMLVVMMVA